MSNSKVQGTPTITALISNYCSRGVAGKVVTFFEVEISIEGQDTWNVEHRFSQFYDLHCALKKVLGNLPPFPTRTLFAMKKKDTDKLERRKYQLDHYIQTISKRTDVLSNEDFLHFLRIEDHVSGLGVQEMEMLGQVVHPHLGFRDVCLLNEKKMFFSITSQMNVMQRADSYLLNIKMPWD